MRLAALGRGETTAAPALLRGYHRAFCIYSVHHRGSRERPGLILGLDRGGSCRGRAFRVAAGDADEVVGYLDSRELITHVYLRRTLPIAIDGMRTGAVCYVADPCPCRILDPDQTAVQTTPASTPSSDPTRCTSITASHPKRVPL